VKKILSLILIFLVAISTGCIFDNDKNNNENGSTTETYKISGKITDSNDNGIADVVVSLTADTTYNTGSTGLYIFTGLSNGTYTVTPGKNGYTFTPETRNISISGEDISGLNFTGDFTGGNGFLAESYIPITQGVSYNYTTTITYADESPEETESYTDAITGATAYSGINYRIKESIHTETGEIQDIQYLRIANNIFWKYLWGEGVFPGASAKTSNKIPLRKALSESAELPLFNFNMSSGESWDIYKDGSGSYKGTFLGIEDVTASAGTFHDCAKFKLTKNYTKTVNEGNDSATIELYGEETFWFAPNVGQVKRYYIKKAGGELLFTESDDLISYTIP